MSYRLGAWCVLLALPACTPDYSDAPVPARGIQRPELPTTEVAPAPPPQRLRDRVRDVPTTEAPTAPTAAAPTEGVTQPVEAAQPRERDLAAELRQAVGNPSACFAARSAKDAPTSLVLDVGGTLTPSGRIVSSYASGSGLTPEEIACLRTRVENAHLSGPIDDAPKAVRASIELQQTPQTPPAKTP